MEDPALKLTQEMLHSYFETQNINAVVSYFDPSISWIGFSKNEIYLSCESVVQALSKEFESRFYSFSIKDTRLFTENGENEFTIVYGSFLIQELSPARNNPEYPMQVTVICSGSSDNIKICHVHISSSSDNKSDRNSKLFKPEDATLQAIFNNIPCGILRCCSDSKFTIQYINNGFVSLFGYTKKEIEEKFHNNFLEMIYPDDQEAILAAVYEQTDSKSMCELEYRVTCKDANTIFILEKYQKIIDGYGKEAFSCVLVDITAQKRKQEELRLSLERHKIIMDQTTDIIFEWDILNDTLNFSHNWEEKFGYIPIRNEISTNIPLNSHIHEKDRHFFVEIMESVRKGTPYAETEFRIQNIEKQFIWCKIRATTQYDHNGHPLKAVGVILDIDTEKKLKLDLLDKAEKDSLTGLYNKMTAQNEVELFLNSTEKSAMSALLMIDIDNFKMLNDHFGHLFGDIVLSKISDEMKKQFRSSDIIGRLGGDEFIVFLKNIPNPEFAQKKAELLTRIFSTLFSDEKDHCKISCSIGISIYPQNGKCFNELYNNADLALYQAKNQGKNRCVLFDKSLTGTEIFELSKHSHTLTTVDSNQNSKSLSDRLTEYIFRIIYKSNDLSTAVNLILELIGKQFNVSRAYIFENTEDGLYCNNTFEWCNIGIKPGIDHLQNVSYQKDLGGNYYDNFDENGIFYCRDISELPKIQYDILFPHGIKSILQCAIRDEGVFKGYVGFDECSKHRYWTKEQVDVLSMLAQILSNFLLKQYSQEQLKRAAKRTNAILEYQSSWIYAVDKKDYRILYMNRKAKELMPTARIGMTCYEAFVNKKSPCDTCPISLVQNGEIKSSVPIESYNPYLNVWTATSVSLFDWDGTDAYLLSCYDISKYKHQS